MPKMHNVWVDEDQRSLAIGKMGQNIALASKLVGVDIHLVQSEGASQQPKSEEREAIDEYEEYEEHQD